MGNFRGRGDSWPRFERTAEASPRIANPAQDRLQANRVSFDTIVLGLRDAVSSELYASDEHNGIVADLWVRSNDIVQAKAQLRARSLRFAEQPDENGWHKFTVRLS